MTEVRDWQKDMKIVENFKFAQTLVNGIQPMFHGQFAPPEPIEYALEHWLQKYKELEWNNENLLSRIYEAESAEAAEKERADKAEDREKKLREAIEEALSWTWDCGENNMTEVISILRSAIYPLEKEEEAK